MTLDEIKSAVLAGHKVKWGNELYDVIQDSIGQWLIVCRPNQYTIGLTHLDGFTVNGKPSDFYIEEQ